MNFKKWLVEGIPLAAAGIAGLVLLVALFWAYQWYQTPFIGAFIEPNMVISQISGKGWAAREAGVIWSDRLVAIDGVLIDSTSELRNMLLEDGYIPVMLTFQPKAGGQYDVWVTPRPVGLGELLTQFGVAYLMGAALLVSGLWAYRLGGSQEATRIFLLFTSAGSILTGAFLDMNTTHHFVVGWTVSISVVAASLAHLALIFPQRMTFVNRYPALIYIPWLAALPVAVTGAWQIWFPSQPWGYITAWKASYFIGGLAMVLFLGMLLYRTFFSDSMVIRQQSRIIIFGAAIAFGPMLFLYVTPMMLGQIPEFKAALYFPPFLIFLLSIAYAIVRYRLLDVDRMLSQLVAYVLISGVAVLVFYSAVTLLSLALEESLNPSHPLVLAVYLFILVVALNPVRNLLQRAIDRIFYQQHADYRQVLTHLSHALVLTPDLDGTLKILERELTEALNPERILLYLYDDEHNFYMPHSTQTVYSVPLPPKNALVRRISRNPQVTRFVPGQPFPEDLAVSTGGRPATPLPERLHCNVFVPLRYEGRLIGFLALGSRRSGTPYTSDDLQFLGGVANQSSLVFENVRLFANLRRTLDETREMKNLMDDMVASIVSGVITLDQAHHIILFNPAAERIFGLQAKHVVGLPIMTVLPSLPQLERIARAATASGTSTVGDELASTLPSRGPLHLRLSCTPLRDANSNIKGATILVDDLTDQRNLEADRDHIRQTFGKVVAPRVRDRLLSNTSIIRFNNGVRQSITVLFADIHGFTPFSEQASPEILFEVLNSYLAIAAQAILDEEGTLDKFMGDAVMALWNVPDEQEDHTLRAVRAALAIHQAVKEHHVKLPADYRLLFSIGITRGEAIVGNVGTADLFNFTAIGDTVNLAQRLESVAEPEQILLSEAAYQAVARHVIAQQLPSVKVKGRQQEVAPYLIQGLRK